MTIQDQLVLHCGLVLTPSAEGVIGVGYDLTRRGPEGLVEALGRPMTDPLALTEDEALTVLRVDLIRAADVLRAFAPSLEVNEVRRRVLLEMMFCAGPEAFQCARVLAACEKRDWSAGAREIYRMKWSAERADRLAKMLLTGVDYVL